MMISMVQHTILTMEFFLLLAFLGCQRSRAFPLGPRQPADPWAHGAGVIVEEPIHVLTDEFGNGDVTWGAGASSSAMTEDLGRGDLNVDIFKGMKSSDEPDWGSYAPHHTTVDHQSDDDDAYGHYDVMDWGSFLPAASSQEAESNHGDFDPLGGGMFTSDIIDPSISHSLYGSSARDQEDISENVDYNSNLEHLPSNGFGINISPSPMNTIGIEQEGVGLPEGGPKPLKTAQETNNHGNNAVHDTHHLKPNPSEDAFPLGNLLSSLLPEDGDIPSSKEAGDNATPDISFDLNGMNKHEEEGGLMDVEDEKSAGRSVDGSNDTLQLEGLTDDMISQIIDLINRLVVYHQQKHAAS